MFEAIRQMQRKLDRLSSFLLEDDHLSDAAQDALQEARETPEAEYVRLE